MHTVHLIMAKEHDNAPTLTDLARQLGIHHSTVSRALRGDTAISSSTRARVHAAAEAAGYRPDPRYRELMARVRATKVSAKAERLAIFRPAGPPPAPAQRAVFTAVLGGIDAEARRHGYQTEVFVESEEPGGLRAERINRILEARGIRGIILLPHLKPDYQLALDLSALTPVAVGVDTLPGLPLHRVCIDAYRAMLNALRHLAREGRKRIVVSLRGIPFPCLREGYLGACHAFDRENPHGARVTVAPMAENLSDPAFRHDVVAQRPDAVLSDCASALSQCVEAAVEPVASAMIGAIEEGHDGLRLPFDRVGKTAVQKVIQQLHAHQHGPPPVPEVTLLNGDWVSTAVLPQFS